MITPITVATNTEKALPFIKSCYNLHAYPVIIGLDGYYPYNGIKIHYVREALKSIKGIVIYADAYDCLLVKSLDLMKRQFLDSGKRIIFAAERNCYPDNNLNKFYPQSKTPYRFLNSGCYIGYAEDLKRVFDKLSWQNEHSDQLTISRYLFEHPDEIELDHRCEFFHCLYISELDLSYGETIKNEITGSEPFIIHGNGLSNMEPTKNWLSKQKDNLISNKDYVFQHNS